MHALPHVHDVQDNLRAVRSKFALTPAGNGIFGCGDRGAKNRHQYTPKPAETKIQEVSGRESPQKDPYLVSYRKRAVCGRARTWTR